MYPLNTYELYSFSNSTIFAPHGCLVYPSASKALASLPFGSIYSNNPLIARLVTFPAVRFFVEVPLEAATDAQSSF